MRKFVLLMLVGVGMALAAPQFASAMPALPGLATAADTVSNVDQVWHRRWHRRHCWHRRHWSGRRCSW